MLPRRLPTAPARFRVIALLVAVASLLALSGCGQAQQVRDALDYSARVNRVLTGFESDLQVLRQRADDAKVPADVDLAVRKLAGSVDGVQSGLRSVKPPPSVTQLHQDLITAFGRWSAPLDRFQRALRTGKRATIIRGKDRFISETAVIQRDVGAVADHINTKLRRLSD